MPSVRRVAQFSPAHSLQLLENGLDSGYAIRTAAQMNSCGSNAAATVIALRTVRATLLAAEAVVAGAKMREADQSSGGCSEIFQIPQRFSAAHPNPIRLVCMCVCVCT